MTSDLSFDLMLSAPQSTAVSIETLFGGGDGQIPRGSMIARVTLQIGDEADRSDVSLMRLLEPASLGETWTLERHAAESAAGVTAFQVQSTVQAWCDGEANHGWALLRSQESPNDAGGESERRTHGALPYACGGGSRGLAARDLRRFGRS